MLSGGAMAAFAYDPRNGKERWRIEVDDFSVSPRPIYNDGIAYMRHRQHPSRTLGDSRCRQGQPHRERQCSVAPESACAHTSSPILVDGLIYMANDDGIIRCFDAATGDSSGKNASAAPTPPRQSMPTATSTSATATAKPPLSTPAASSTRSPRTRSTTASWPHPSLMAKRSSCARRPTCIVLRAPELQWNESLGGLNAARSSAASPKCVDNDSDRAPTRYSVPRILKPASESITPTSNKQWPACSGTAVRLPKLCAGGCHIAERGAPDVVICRVDNFIPVTICDQVQPGSAGHFSPRHVVGRVDDLIVVVVATQHNT